MTGVRTAAALFAMLVPLAAPAGHAQEAVAHARTIEEHLTSEALRNRIGDPEVRRVVVHLPPSYHAEPERRYPVVILLHAFGSRPEAWLGDSAGYEGLDVTRALDSLVRADSAAEMILVLPDVSNRFGGSWLANSTSGGRWEDFIARDLVALLDARYRTIPDRRSRAIAGHSMGGYGAMRIAAHRPDVFGAALVMSPPMVREPNPFGEPAMAAALASARDGDVAEDDALARVTLAKAVAFSPDGARPPFFAALPYEERNGRLVRDEAVWDMWTRATLVGQIARASRALADVRIRIEVGAADPAAAEAGSLERALAAAGARPELVRFEGDHTAGVRERFEGPVFRWLSAVLRR